MMWSEQTYWCDLLYRYSKLETSYISNGGGTIAAFTLVIPHEYKTRLYRAY